jgi:Xaa-Pro aminopeptidase
MTTLPPRPGRITIAEHRERMERARAAADEAGLDGLLAWSSRTAYWAVQYLAGYASGFQLQGNAPTFGDKGHCALVLPVDGEPVLVMDQRVEPGSVAVDDARTAEAITPLTGAALRDTGLAGGRIGVVGTQALLLRQQREIEAAAGTELDLVLADHLVEPMVRVKSAAELELCRYASAVGAAWMAAMMESIAPGMTEADVVAAGLPVILGAGGFPMDVMCGSGNPSRPQADRGIPGFDSRRPFERGDVVRVDGFGPVLGYGCDLARSACVDAEPTDAQREVLEDCVSFVRTILDAMRPGVTLGALHDLGVAFLTERGHPPHGYFEGFWPAFGHQIGLTTEGPFIAEGETAELEPGMVMSVEIVMGTPETGGLTFEESVIVTDDGIELLTGDCPAVWW